MYQKIKLQELHMDNARNHQTITVELRHNHVGTYISGDKVEVHGVLKTEMENNALFTKYIEANNISNLCGEEQSEFSQKDMELINHHMKEKTLFAALVKSFCPAIYGHELVKAGLLLCMIGLNSKKRMNSHCLMIGDPGQGKSQLLKFVSLIAPRSVYVSGTGTSQCGLTCSLRNEEIDAGALVMADQGVCCIDEFEKMADLGGLLEAMEQQTVSLAKAGVLCQLQARASVLATANPLHGHYQKHKSFMDNIKIPTTILSRFDLIFLMLDDVDPHRDEKLSKHILQMPYKQNRDDWQGSLKSRLQDHADQLPDQLQFTPQQMKHLIAHIKKHSEPRFSHDASRAIGQFYIKLRKSGNEIGITTRTLESLVRLSISKCKFDLRDEVSLEDAEFVISLMEECKFDCFY